MYISGMKKKQIQKALSDYFSKIGRRGGLKGGQARAATLSATERSESARKAVMVRWAKRKNAKRD